MDTKAIFIMTLLSLMAVLMFIGVPIGSAVFIYKHAKKHPQLGNPLHLSLLAAFVPFYLGIVYYLYRWDEYSTQLYDESHTIK